MAKRRTYIGWIGGIALSLSVAFLGRGALPEAAGRRAAAPEPASPEAAAVAAWSGDRVLGVPIYPGARPATDLAVAMRNAWIESGEPPELFAARLGEEILATEAPFDRVRDFYLPLATKVFMDHEMGIPEIGKQRMLTAILAAPDGTLVKLTITRPFFRYPDQRRIDETVVQMGRVGRVP